jgi:elongation factor 3
MSDAEGNKDDMKFRSRKKKKMTKKELKDREVRRRLRYIDWLNSPKVCFLFSIIVNIMNGLLTV